MKFFLKNKTKTKAGDECYFFLFCLQYMSLVPKKRLSSYNCLCLSDDRFYRHKRIVTALKKCIVSIPTPAPVFINMDKFFSKKK